MTQKSSLGLEVQVHQIVITASVPVFQKLLVEDSVFAEILADIQKDAIAVIFKIELVSAYAYRGVLDCKRYHFVPLKLPNCRSMRINISLLAL